MPKPLVRALILALTLAAAVLGTARPARAQIGDSVGISPFLDWRTLETDHFRVTFPADHEGTARKAAQYLEEAHALLTPKLRWEPKYRTQILILDNTDSANGLTSPVQRIGIVLLTTPPDDWFSTYYYDDWLRLLCIHEYTHLVNMDVTTGIYEPLRWLVGPNLLPNSIWPPWMLEGLAVYMETKYTRAGRGRSPLYEMVLRAGVESGALDTDRFVTLDRVNANDPYYPGGETNYLFGYELMNQVARQPYPGGRTADGRSAIAEGDGALGEMSLRSGGRVPFFINGNLENVSGRDWYGIWDGFVRDTRARMTAELARLRAQPLTKVERLTVRGYGALGSAASPDGKWLAYTQESLDRRTSLYLRNLDTGEVRHVSDKSGGVGLAFTPDSRRLVFSELDRKSVYREWSDLRVYDLERDARYWLTDGLRAKDPDVSPDGKWVVFTVAGDATVSLVAAPLERKGDDLSLGLPRKLFAPLKYDRASTPKFGPDGKTVAFTLHRNGHPGSELLSAPLEPGPSTTLVADGSFVRFPAYDRAGRLHFVSDRTGVDNLYRLGAHGPEQVTNVTTGIWLPTFGPRGAYASVFSIDGWDLARIEPAATPYPSAELTMAPPPAPATRTAPAAAAEGRAQAARAQAHDYSIFPSIWPRQWAPIAYFDRDAFYLGGEVLGYDALDRHAYILGGFYDSQTKKADWLALYSNRSFGPTLTVNASDRTTDRELDAGGVDLAFYERKFEAEARISYPFLWTWSSLTPSLGINAERTSLYVPSIADDRPVDSADYVPSADALAVYSDAETSRLANGPEGGRIAQAGFRVYDEGGAHVGKGLLTDREYLRMTTHSVLIPEVKASWSTRQPRVFSVSSVQVRGRIDRLIDSLPGADFDELGLRGYPGKSFYARAAAVGSLDYRFPIANVYRAWGTNPLSVDDLYGFVFAESAYFPESGARIRALPAAGGGVVLDATALIQVPLMLSLEYHRGFREEFGGRGELFAGLNIGAFLF